MMEHLGIAITQIADDFIEATMPVDHRTHQPEGLLHGGASVVLAESLGSIASGLLVDLKKQGVVGVEINANHIRSVKAGKVLGRVRPVHVGRTTHVWDIQIYSPENKLLCISRLTCAVLNK